MHTKFNQDILKSHLKNLISLEDSEDPVFSFYLNLARTPTETIHIVRNELSQLRYLLKTEEYPQSIEAEKAVEHFVAKEAHPLSKSAALFYRGGEHPFYLSIQFQLPLNDHILIDRVPHIVPLIEFKDRYDRYVILIATEEKARILEVVLGEASKEQWIQRPMLRKRIGREWTREHYQNHKRGRADKFLKEKIALLERVFHQGGYGHLIIAGAPKLVSKIKAALPKALEDKVIDTMKGTPNDKASQIINATIEAFVVEETNESKKNLQRLEEAVLSDGPASVGVALCEQAFEQHQVDMLLITRNEEKTLNDSGRGLATVKVHNHNFQGGNKQSTNLIKRREAVLKAAVQQNCEIEFVPRGSFLDNFDGIGVLLRYKGNLTTQSTAGKKNKMEAVSDDRLSA